MPGTYVELCVTLISMIIGSVLFLVVVGTLPTVILESEVSAAAQELEGDHVPLPTARCASPQHQNNPDLTAGVRNLAWSWAMMNYQPPLPVTGKG